MLLLGTATCFLYSNPEFRIKLAASFSILIYSLEHPALYIVIFLVVINWGLEAKKWQILVKPLKKIAFFESMRSVLIGLGSGLFAPREVGDYFGRILSLDLANRWRLTGAMLIAGLTQLSATLVFGLISLFFVHQHFMEIEKMYFLAAFLVLLVLFFLLFVFRHKVTFLLKSKLFKIYRLFYILKQYDKKVLSKVVALSFFRHLVYTIQFILVLKMIDASLNFLELIPYVSMIYLMKAMIPSINVFSDLGVRELSSVFFLGMCGISVETALAAGMFIWLLNIVFPSAVGGLMIWRR